MTARGADAREAERGLALPATESDAMPLVCDRAAGLGHGIAGRRLAVVPEFDGTLAPMVEHRRAAELPGKTRRTGKRLAGVAPVAPANGRGLADVGERVGAGDVFRALKGRGGEIAIAVRGVGGRGGCAHDALPDMEAARDFLGRLARQCEESA